VSSSVIFVGIVLIYQIAWRFRASSATVANLSHLVPKKALIVRKSNRRIFFDVDVAEKKIMSALKIAGFYY
jgi:hypothetical protein